MSHVPFQQSQVYCLVTSLLHETNLPWPQGWRQEQFCEAWVVLVAVNH
jgi:hypothetical protein